MGRLRFRGLDADRTYRVTPTLVGGVPSGLVPPPWWRTRAGDPLVLSGASLEYAGVQPPRLHPDQVVLFRITAVDAPARGQEEGRP
jgi:alpha-galactosidase